MRWFPLLIAISVLGCSRKEDQRPVRTEPEPAVLAPPGAKAAAAEPVALVELYTSEGCSSCPPADENLTRIAYAARDSGKRVIALSFHVDYWNYIGWKDPFSAAEYSERQRRYARIGFEVRGPPRQVVVHIAAAQGAGGVKVKTGENAGRTLSHVNVVRALSSKRTRAPGGGQLTLDVPTGVDKRSAMVVAWAEDAETGHVLGAIAKSGLLVSSGP